MTVTLYSTGCPMCKVLEQVLDDKGIKYDKVTDTGIMIEKGYKMLPVLEIDSKVYIGSEALCAAGKDL